MLSPRILYVEDDDDIRAVVTQALSTEGFDVTAVPSAEEALRDLTSATFDVLLTDYRLPCENAAWLIRESNVRGYLTSTPVIVLSSEVDPVGIEGHTFLRKPIDLDVLSAALATALQGSTPTRPSDPRGTAEKLPITLYVTAGSHVSQKAIRNLHRIMRGFDAAQVHVTVTEIETEIDECDGAIRASIEVDRIVVTPTLVVRLPDERIWIAGDLSNAPMVEDVIARGLRALAESAA